MSSNGTSSSYRICFLQWKASWELEKAWGMGMLTVGPIFTAIASAMFDSGGLDPHALLNKRMVMTELVELSGILFSDLSFAEAFESSNFPC